MILVFEPVVFCAMHICPKILFRIFRFFLFGHSMTRSLCCRSFLGSLPLTIFNFEEEERFYFWQSASYFFTIFTLFFTILVFRSFVRFHIFSCFFRVFFVLGFDFHHSALLRIVHYHTSFCSTQLHSIPLRTSPRIPHPTLQATVVYDFLI